MRLMISSRVKISLPIVVRFYLPPAGRSLFSPALESNSGEGERLCFLPFPLDFLWDGLQDVSSSDSSFPASSGIVSSGSDAILRWVWAFCFLRLRLDCWWDGAGDVSLPGDVSFPGPSGVSVLSASDAIWRCVWMILLWQLLPFGLELLHVYIKHFYLVNIAPWYMHIRMSRDVTLMTHVHQPDVFSSEACQ